MNLPSAAPSSSSSPATASSALFAPEFSPVCRTSPYPSRSLKANGTTAKPREIRTGCCSCSSKPLIVKSGFRWRRRNCGFGLLLLPQGSAPFGLVRFSLSRGSGKRSLDATSGGAKNIVIKRFSDDGGNTRVGSGGGTDFPNSFREDPIVDKLSTQLGVIHPLPYPPVNRNVLGLFALFFFVGVVFDKIWTRTKRLKLERRVPFMWPQVPTTSFSTFLENDLQRKESVEWVNMVLGKLWKVYRGGIEDWIVGLLQPVIDDLAKPDYVQRVEVKQFSLGDESLSVRSVERKTSRRANDLQYQIGIRYTGDARMLLMLSLKLGIIPIVVPVGIRDFDIDGVLWVKLQLIPTEPWVGNVSWAFVSLPKIKFELSPFRLFNLMAIPVLSMFLTKLLTEDLPRLYVRPKKIVLDFQKGKAVGPVAPVANGFKTGEINEKNKDYSGELSVTLVDACNLAYMLYGKTDPYVVFTLGDQSIRSKKNSQTTVIGPPGEPIWNQDFHMLVSNPRKQKLSVQVRDSVGFAEVTIGTGEVDISSLEDTVPTDRIVALKGGWSLFKRGNCGEILIRLTYKAYVEDEEDDYTYSDASEDEVSDLDEADTTTNEPEQREFLKEETNKESFMDVLAALIVSEEFQGIVASEAFNPRAGDGKTNSASTIPSTRVRAATESPPSKSDRSSKGVSEGSVLLWLAVLTSAAVLMAVNMSGSNPFNP